MIMKKDEIIKKLKELDVQFDSKMTKDELKKLLDETLAKGEEEEQTAEKEQAPKKYMVIEDFKDLRDKGYIYIKGDLYPREGNKDVTKERIEELSTNKNKRGKPLIKEQE